MKKEINDPNMAYGSILQILEEALKPANDMKEKIEQLLDYHRKAYANLDALSNELNQMVDYEPPSGKDMLNVAIHPIISELCQRTVLMTEFFPQMLITQAKESVETISAMIANQRDLFKDHINTIIDTKKDFDVGIKQFEFSNINEALSKGFQTHKAYLQYFYNIKNVTQDVLNSLNTIQDNIVKANKNYDKSLKYCNKLFIAKFGAMAGTSEDHVQAMKEARDRFDEEVLMVVEHCKNAIQPKLSALNLPQISLPAWKTFSSEVCMKLVCNENFRGDSSYGEISVSQGDVVDLVDATSVDFWKVTKQGAETGYVPSLILSPQKLSE